MRIETAFGPVWADVSSSGALQAFGFGAPPRELFGESNEVGRQIAEYCAGTRKEFELDLNPKGTVFQKLVWAELMKIPYGETISYSQLAERVGRPSAPRAVGRANATNPIALIVPCHRVIGSNGTLTGYAYGTDLKRRLLDWESSTTRQNLLAV